MIYSVTELEKRGAHVVAGKVVMGRAFVEGVWTRDGFEPADPQLFEPKLKARRAALATATDVDVKELS